MKNIVFKLLFLQVIFAHSLMGQFCNDGATVIIQSDAFIHIQGDFVNQGGTICNEGLIEVGGNWNNAADAFPLSPGTGEVSFVGTNHTISGNFNTLFNNLTLSGNQQISLERGIGILNTTQLNDGFIELNQNIFHMLSNSNDALQFGNGGILSSNTTDHGFVRWDIGEDAEGIYEIPFFADAQARTPVTFEVSEQGIGEDGYLLFGTYATDSANNPLPNDVSNIDVDGINTGQNVVDRFWSVDAINYTEQPTTFVDFSFDAVNSADSEVISYNTTSMTWSGLATTGLSGNSIETLIADTYGYFSVSGNFASQNGDSDQMGGGQMGDDQTIVNYSLDECDSFIDERQSNIVYDEFTPAFPSQLSCADVTASIVNRRSPTMNPHSCTPGINGTEAMCVSSLDDCMYQADSDNAVRFAVIVDPLDDTESFISGLTFYEKAPVMFDWIDGPSGINNYPTLYGVRVLKNGEEIYSRIDQNATTEWTLESFSFDSEEFRVTERAEFVFELLGYCTVGNGSDVNAWDVDEISIIGNCQLETAASASISGLITSSFGEVMQDVNVITESNNPEYPVSTITNANGAYSFSSNPMGDDYTTTAFKVDDYINGISLADLIQIQRHILGVELLDTPYKILAADVNNSGDINFDDLIELLKLILGVDTDLQDEDSWMFVSDQEIFDPQNPSNVQTFIQNYNLIADNTSNDFIGIKMGDVDGSAFINSNERATISRNDIALGLHFQDQSIVSGEVYQIDVKSSNFNEVYGFQFTTELNGIELVDIQAESIDLTTENVGVSNSDLFTLAYAKAKVVSAENDEVLFSIKFKANKSGLLSEMLSISNSVTTIEAYINNSFDKVSVTLDSKSISEASGFTVYQNYPNPFNQHTDISFNLDKESDVELMIYDVSGKNIYQKNQFFPKGFNSFRIGQRDLKEQTGLLFYRVSANGFSEIRKMSFTN